VFSEVPIYRDLLVPERTCVQKPPLAPFLRVFILPENYGFVNKYFCFWGFYGLQSPVAVFKCCAVPSNP